MPRLPRREIAPPPTAETDNRDRHLLGVGLMIGGVLAAPIIDLFAKGLGQGYFGADAEAPIWAIGEAMGALQIGWGRFLFQALLLLPLVVLFARTGLRAPKRFGLVLLRGALMAGAACAFFAGLRYLQLAEAIAIFFVEPLILTVLSALFLSEKIGWRRSLAILGGLAGAMLIIRPNFLEVGWPALFPVATAFLFALYLMITRMLAKDESPLVLQFWSGVVGCALLSVVLGLLSAVTPSSDVIIALEPRHWLVFLGLGAIATFCHMLISAAFRYAEASALAPLQYFEIFAAALLGYLFFGEVLDQTTLIGLLMIIGAGLFVIRRESALREAGRELHRPEEPLRPD